MTLLRFTYKDRCAVYMNNVGQNEQSIDQLNIQNLQMFIDVPN